MLKINKILILIRAILQESWTAFIQAKNNFMIILKCLQHVYKGNMKRPV